MKKLLFILTFFCYSLSHAQMVPAGKEYYSPMFKWRIVFPSNFKNLTADEYAKVQKKGADAIEKTFDAKIENHSKQILALKSDQMHYIESNYQPYNVKVDGDYSTSCKAVTEVVYQTFVKQMPGAKIDTSYNTELIGGLKFNSFTANIHFPNKMVLTMHMFNRLFYANKDFTMVLMYLNRDTGASMMDAWRKSTFEK